MKLIDLRHMHRDGLIGAWRVDDVLVDCGPSSCLPVLLDALGDCHPRALLLTHVHLDHAGAAGALAARWPDLEVWVHRLGARHLLDPTRLVSSAQRVFGGELERLFGTVPPVPPANLRILDGGEQIGPFEVLYTPGHASHHVCFVHDSGCAFVGDVAGVRLSQEVILPPTPPPDIDLELWRQSIDEVLERQPSTLAITHFGLIEDPRAHLDELARALSDHGQLAKASDGQQYVSTVSATLASRLSGNAVDDYNIVVPLDQNYAGLQRWLAQSGRAVGEAESKAAG